MRQNGERHLHGRPQTFFQGGGAITYNLPEKHTIFLKKVLKHSIWAGQEGGQGGGSMPSPADAHGHV